MIPPEPDYRRQVDDLIEWQKTRPHVHFADQAIRAVVIVVFVVLAAVLGAWFMS